MSKTLTVYLAANLKDFNNGLDDAERKTNSFGSSLGSMLGPALAGAAIAAGALAVKLGVDGVKAAMEDEAAAAKLAQTLNNLGLAHATGPVEDYISSLETEFGIADNQLRPAFDRLVRSTHDVNKAQELLSLSLDVSAGTGRDLQSVVMALGKAADGSTTGLARLGAGLDKATLASGDLDKITKALGDTFAGQASVKAGTLQGSLDRITLAADNLKEAFGLGVIDAFNNTSDTADDLVSSLNDLEPVMRTLGASAGEGLMNFAKNMVVVGAMAKALKGGDFGKLAELLNSQGDALVDLSVEYMDTRSVMDKFRQSSVGVYIDSLKTADGLKIAGQGGYAAAEGFDEAAAGADNAAAALNQLIGQAKLTAQSLASLYGPTLTKLLDIGAIDEFWKRVTTLDTGVGPTVDKIVEHNRRGGSSNRELANSAEDMATRVNAAYDSIYQSAEKSLNGWMDRLDEAVGSLDEATQAIEEWSADTRDSLLSAFDIGAAYENSINKEGQVDGQAWIAGLTAQINKLDWFGNVLTELKRRGADPSLIQYLASQGADAGGAMGQAMIDQGIVPEMIGMSAAANAAATNLAAGMVPAFLLEAQGMASGAVIQLAEQVEASKDKLISIGKAIGKPVGAGFAKEISEAVADALEKAERTRSAAQARRQAEQASQAVTAITDQQVGQSLQRIINNSNARAGYVSNAFGIVLG